MLLAGSPVSLRAIELCCHQLHWNYPEDAFGLKYMQSDYTLLIERYIYLALAVQHEDR